MTQPPAEEECGWRPGRPPCTSFVISRHETWPFPFVARVTSGGLGFRSVRLWRASCVDGRMFRSVRARQRAARVPCMPCAAMGHGVVVRSAVWVRVCRLPLRVSSYKYAHINPLRALYTSLQRHDKKENTQRATEGRRQTERTVARSGPRQHVDERDGGHCCTTPTVDTHGWAIPLQTYSIGRPTLHKMDDALSAPLATRQLSRTQPKYLALIIRHAVTVQTRSNPAVSRLRPP